MKKNFYVVWIGKEPGVYNNWEDANSQVHKYQGAKHEGFETLEQAFKAYELGYEAYTADKENKKKNRAKTLF